MFPIIPFTQQCCLLARKRKKVQFDRVYQTCGENGKVMRFAKLKIKPPPVNIPLVVYISMASILGTCTGLVVSRSFSFDYVLGSSLAISVSIIGLCIHKKKT